MQKEESHPNYEDKQKILSKFTKIRGSTSYSTSGKPGNLSENNLGSFWGFCLFVCGVILLLFL